MAVCRPVLFLKPPSAAVFAAEQNAHVPVELVKGKGDVHYEAEVVLRLNEALEVDAVTLGLDLTLRDLQAKLKRDGHPWEIAKVRRHMLYLTPSLIRCPDCHRGRVFVKALELTETSLHGPPPGVLSWALGLEGVLAQTHRLTVISSSITSRLGQGIVNIVPS